MRKLLAAFAAIILTASMAMAVNNDLSITAASVATTASTVSALGTAGGTVTAGQLVYLNGSNLLVGVDANVTNNSATTTTAAIKGVALNGASANQPLVYATAGHITLNAVLTSGVLYVAGDGTGKIAPSTDLAGGATTRYVSVLGVATSTTDLLLNIGNSSVTVAVSVH